MREIVKRKKTTSEDIHPAGNVNLNARFCCEWLLSKLSHEQTNENISKVNIFTDNIAHPLVNLLMQHRHSSGNSVYSFSRVCRDLKEVLCFYHKKSLEWTKCEVDLTYPFTAASQKHRCLLLILVLCLWNLTFLPNKALCMCHACEEKYPILKGKLPLNFKRCCSYQVLTMVQTSVFIQAEIADI